jgi:CHAD domain-containing protein
MLTECYNQAALESRQILRPCKSPFLKTMNPRSHNQHANLVQRQADLVFTRMSRSVGRLAKNAKAEDVHRFRTNSRRVEALVDELAPENGNSKKLLKQLSKLRKRAGKVRDLDVQIAFLKELKIPDRQNHRAQLLDILVEEQARRSKKLIRQFGAEKVKRLRKRLRKTEAEVRVDGIDPLQIALSRLPKPSATPATEKMLHAARIAAKRARYLAELAADSPDAKSFVAELKKAQDEIGHWHDVLKLSQRAERLFGGVHDSPLVAALENISRARFRRAANGLHEAVKAISDSQPKAPEAPKPKATESASAAKGAAA